MSDAVVEWDELGEMVSGEADELKEVVPTEEEELEEGTDTNSVLL
jgi:hypothetical protein